MSNNELTSQKTPESKGIFNAQKRDNTVNNIHFRPITSDQACLGPVFTPTVDVGQACTRRISLPNGLIYPVIEAWESNPLSSGHFQNRFGTFAGGVP